MLYMLAASKHYSPTTNAMQALTVICGKLCAIDVREATYLSDSLSLQWNVTCRAPAAKRSKAVQAAYWVGYASQNFQIATAGPSASLSALYPALHQQRSY